MALTITLPPDVEQILRERAAREGLDVEAIATATLVRALAWEAQDSGEVIQRIHRGLDDFAAGRYRSLKDFAREQRQKYRLPSEE